MKIQKGMVKYKDRNDIICMYGVTDDGKTYYFLDGNDGKTFTNGNRVVTTELVEAIDPMVKASNVGVIDGDGNEVIKCENKAVKLIYDNVVLVEKANPVTESVLSAIGNRSDPLNAAKLVSTPAQIKDNIYHEMGTDGRFLFNDQFSEATVCDIDGNNLVNNEVYSFIAMNNDHLYLSKNTPDSSVVHFVLGENKVEEDVSFDSVQKVKEDVSSSSTVEEGHEGDLGQNSDESEIDVSDVNVPIDVVENALEGGTITSDSNVIQDNFEIDANTPIENVNEGLVAPSADEFLATSSVGAVDSEEFVMEGTSESSVDNGDVQVPSQDELVTESGDSLTEESMPAEESSEEVIEEVIEGSDSLAEEGMPAEESSEDVAEEATESSDALTEESTFVEEPSEEVDAPLGEEDIQSLLDETSTDLFNGTSLKVDTIVNDSYSQDDLDNYALSLKKMSDGSENFLGDVAKSMTALIRQNREQRDTIVNYEGVIDGLNSSKDELKNRVASLEQENSKLNDKNRSLEDAVVKLKSRIEMLAGRLQEQEEKISEQAHELQVIRPQLEGREQLIDLLKDAQALIGDGKASEEEYGYSKAA